MLRSRASLALDASEPNRDRVLSTSVARRSGQRPVRTWVAVACILAIAAACGARPDAQQSAAAVMAPAAAAIPMHPMPGAISAVVSTGSTAWNEPGTLRWTASTTGWLALDLAQVPVAERERVLVALDHPNATFYHRASGGSFDRVATRYRIDAHTDNGAVSPPAGGWVSLASVVDNPLSAPQNLVDVAGARWLRLSVEATSTSGLTVDLRLFSAPDGANDDWLFLGDSITVIAATTGSDGIDGLVSGLDPGRTPLVVPAGVGGATTASALTIIGDALQGFAGDYVVLGYGTNDYPPDFDMESLVKAVTATGKTPVVPTVPWSDYANGQLQAKLSVIQQLYLDHNDVLRGPDFWNAFRNRTDLIPSGDVHPNEAGAALWRSLWASVMAANTPGIRPTSTVISSIDGPATVSESAHAARIR